MRLNFAKISKYLPYGLGFFFAVLYIMTLSPTVNFIDSGELATVCCTLGIAHPTGYPLFTLVGHLFSKAALFGSEIYTLNLMCALFCAAGLFFFYKFNFLLHSNIIIDGNGNKNKKKKNSGAKSNNEILKLIAVASAVISLGLSKNFWDQSTSIEVYPLHILLLSILLLVFLKNFNKQLFVSDNLNRDSLKGWLLFAFLLGLGFSNHMTTIFLIPAFAFMFFYENKFKSGSFKVLLILLVPFFAGLSLYLYLPLRAATNPTINWGDPSTFDALLRHVSGRQYSIWVFSSVAEMKAQMKYFFSVVPEDYLYLPVLVSLLGIVYLFKNSRKYFYFTIILFLTCFLLAVNYSIVDIDSYFLLAYFIISVWIGFGILWLYIVFIENGKVVKPQYLLIFLAVPLIELSNYSKVDESRNYLVEDYTMNIFKSVAPGGIVLSYQWDNWVSAAYYFQHVKGIRKDIVVIDKELSRRSWYLKQLSKNYPQIAENSKKEIAEFLQEVYKFEHNLPYDGVVIEEKYIAMLNSFIDKNIKNVPVYVTNEIEKEVGSTYKRIPNGLVYRLNSKIEYLNSPVDIAFRPYNKKGKYPEMLLSFYGLMLTNRASYENYFNHKDKAYGILEKLQSIYPDYGPALNLKRSLDDNGQGI
jgi:hypothetical protein